MVTSAILSRYWGTYLSAAHEDNQVIVLERSHKPYATLISHDLWLVGQERAVEPSRFQEKNSRAAQAVQREIRECLGRGVDTVITVDHKPKAVITRYEWTRETFPELGLPATATAPACAMVVYRSPRHLAELRAQYADSPDPDWEMDRHLSAGHARIPAIRRELLVAVVYVHEGVVARVRAVDPRGTWQDMPAGRVSVAPVSEPLTGLALERKIPGLGIMPGDKREPRWGLWREYVDLTPATDD